MISVIYYGRNDNHGYNLHKRAALSLNNVAELLTHKDDEILFVDWNTQFALPTFIEAIEDTLSQKAKSLIRIIKVSSEIHESNFKPKSNKELIEPVARNVAIRRSCSRNKWILSTNLDMIFLPVRSNSLNEIVNKLPESYYGIPRFSLPEIYWDNLPRANSKMVLQKIEQDCKDIDLEEIVSANNLILYDAPGDFQLFSRSQIFEINGFDERMIHGWHVDSNLAKRFFLLNGSNQTLINDLKGYHCEHTKIPTHFTNNSTQNNLIEFYEKIDSYFLNQPDWGLKNFKLEKVSIDQLKQNKEKILRQFSRKTTDRSSINANDMGNLITYPIGHAMPYIIDLLESIDDEWKVLYIGKSTNNFVLLSELLFSYKKIKLINYSLEFNSDNSINFFKAAKVLLILDLGLNDNSKNYNLSTFRHIDNHLQEFFKIQDAVCELLDLFISQRKNQAIYEWPIITLNAETYDYGVGTTLKKWVTQPQVAANSRVRSGFFRDTLKNRNDQTLIRLRDKHIKDLYPLREYDFSTLAIMLDNNVNNYCLNGHQIYPYIQDKKDFSLTPRGVFLKEKGELAFNFETQDFLPKKLNMILEFDKPIEDHYYSRSYLKIVTKNQEKNFSFEADSSTSYSLEINDLTYSDLTCFKVSFYTKNDDNFRESIRLTNLMIYSEHAARNIIYINPNSLKSRSILQSGISFSNEGKKRWITSNNIEFKIPKDINYSIFHFDYPLINAEFIKVLNLDDPMKEVKFECFKPIFFKKHLFLIIFNLEMKELNLNLKLQQKPFKRFTLNSKDSRKLFVSLRDMILIRFQANRYVVRLIIILRFIFSKLLNL